MAAPALVREVATILAPKNIPVMPLKGVLLQQLVYKTAAFRPMSDVDLLVPSALFPRACSALRGAGFQALAAGGDVFRRRGHILEVDLHRKLSTTIRSRLLPSDMFRRGKTDAQLFGVPVVLPSPEDLFAHLLLHMTLHWVNHGTLHHPEDLEAVPEVLALSVPSIIEHLKMVGLVPHALLIFPLIEAHQPGRIAGRLLSALSLSTAERVRAEMSLRLCARSSPSSAVRRLGGFLLAPSVPQALREAVMGRFFGRQRSSAD